RKYEYLSEQFAKADTFIRSHFRQQLEQVWLANGADASDGKKQVLDHLTSTLGVFPISAPQYRRFLVGDPDNPAFIQSGDQSGVPRLRHQLLHVVEQRQYDAQLAREELVNAFVAQVMTQAELVRAQWAGAGHTDQEVEQLEKDLAKAMEPLKERFRVR